MLLIHMIECAMNIFYDQVVSRAFAKDCYLLFDFVRSRRMFDLPTNSKEISFEERVKFKNTTVAHKRVRTPITFYCAALSHFLARFIFVGCT